MREKFNHNSDDGSDSHSRNISDDDDDGDDNLFDCSDSNSNDDDDSSLFGDDEAVAGNNDAIVLQAQHEEPREDDQDDACMMPPCSKRLKYTTVNTSTHVSPNESARVQPYASTTTTTTAVVFVTDGSDNSTASSQASDGGGSGTAPLTTTTTAAVSLSGISSAPPLIAALELLDPKRGFFLRSGCVATLTFATICTTGGASETTTTLTNHNPFTATSYDDDCGIQLTPAALSFSSKANVQDFFHQALEQNQRLKQNTASAEEPVSLKLLEDWLGERSGDSENAIVQSVKRYNRLRKLDSDILHVLGEDEMALWRHHRPPCLRPTATTTDVTHQQGHTDTTPAIAAPPPQLSLRNLAKLRRLLLPITVQLVHAESPDSACCTHPIDVSMMDVWLRQCAPQPQQQPRERDANDMKEEEDDDDKASSTGNACRMSNTMSSTLRHRIIDRLLLMGVLLRSHSQSFAGATHVLYEYRRILLLILRTLRRVGGSYLYQGDWINLRKLRVEHLPLPLQGMGRSRRSCSENERLERLDLAAKRKELWNENKELMTTRKARFFDGHMLITEKEDGMSLETFLKETYFMNKVNAGIPRSFVPFKSRPRMASLYVTPSSLDSIKSVLFDAEGCLNRDIVPDISQSKKHHYITFTNSESCGAMDQRWQIPIRLCPSPGLVRTRTRIEAILQEAGLLNAKREKIHDMGILVGGTEDQSLHHDICRQWTFWLPHIHSQEEPTLGWEQNRYAYNDAMADRYAPTSFLIGMGRSDILFIGVQKDQIERVRDGSHCRIKLGRPHEIFKIVRENQHLVVLEASVGCVFTGDFQHAGVRNVSSGSPEEKLLQELNRRIGKVLERQFENHGQQTSAIIEMLCQFKGLDQLCRLHCSTELLHARMTIPRNTVGYTSCKVNKVDGATGNAGFDERAVDTTTPPKEQASRETTRKLDVKKQTKFVATSKHSRLKGQSLPPTGFRHDWGDGDHKEEDSESSDPSESEWERDF